MPFKHSKILKAVLLALVSLLIISGCGKENESTSDIKSRRLTLNWFPEVEHGGYFQAFVKENSNVDIESGGPDIPVIQKVALGQSDFGIVNADDVINAQAQGADVVALFAPLNQNPRCIMVRADSKINKFEELQNMTLALSSRPAFSHWLRFRFPLKGVTIVPYPGSISPFIQRNDFAQQAYNISEPFLAQKAGVEPKVLMVSDLGFNPYGSVLITRRALISEQKALVQQVVQAAQKGWLSYLKDGTTAHQSIHKVNPEMSLEILEYGHGEIQTLCAFPENEGYGSMQLERWAELKQQMVECGLIKAEDFNVENCFDNSFLLDVHFNTEH